MNKDDFDRPLIEALITTATFLEQYGETLWSDILRKEAGRDPLDRASIRAIFGGMGSFNDLMLSPDNRHKILETEVKAANLRLDELGTRIFDLARSKPPFRDP